MRDKHGIAQYMVSMIPNGFKILGMVMRVARGYGARGTFFRRGDACASLFFPPTQVGLGSEIV